MMDRFFGIGGWLNVEYSKNYLAYADTYKGAVKALIDHFEKSPEELLKQADNSDDPEPYLLPEHALGILPLVYNFRHYVELKLKGLILMKGGKIRNTHDIWILLHKLKEVSRNPRVTKETEDIIEKLQKSDNKSADAFRYPYDAEQKIHFSENSEFLEIVNNFSKFKNAVDTVIRDLTNVEGDFDNEQENLDAEREARDFSS